MIDVYGFFEISFESFFLLMCLITIFLALPISFLLYYFDDKSY